MFQVTFKDLLAFESIRVGSWVKT